MRLCVYQSCNNAEIWNNQSEQLTNVDTSVTLPVFYLRALPAERVDLTKPAQRGSKSLLISKGKTGPFRQRQTGRHIFYLVQQMYLTLFVRKFLRTDMKWITNNNWTKKTTKEKQEQTMNLAETAYRGTRSSENQKYNTRQRWTDASEHEKYNTEYTGRNFYTTPWRRHKLLATE